MLLPMLQITSRGMHPNVSSTVSIDIRMKRAVSTVCLISISHLTIGPISLARNVQLQVSTIAPTTIQPLQPSVTAKCGCIIPSGAFFHLLDFHTYNTTDVSHYGWVASAGWAGVNMDEFPALMAWEERMTARPGVEKGRHIPDPHTIKALLKDKTKMEAQAAKAREWVQAGMREDAARRTVGK